MVKKARKMPGRSSPNWAKAKIAATGSAPDSDGSSLSAQILVRLNGLIFLIADTFPRQLGESDEMPAKKAKGRTKKLPGRQEDLSVRLAQAGLRPAEIATLTVRHPNNVSRDLSKARKEGRLPPVK